MSSIIPVSYTHLDVYKRQKEDLLHCVFFLLGCSKETILLCTRASEGAFKSRKSRMKIKLGEEFFEWMTIRQYLVS